MSIVHTLWVEGALSPLNHLSIRSFQDSGHTPIVYSFDDSINPGCEVRDASEFFSKDEIYFYSQLGERFKFGGIAERLKSEMLYKIGGWHVDMDVVCLRKFDFKDEYVLRPHRLGVVGNIIKAPARCQMSDYYRAWTRTINKDNKDFERSFCGLTAAATFLDLNKYVVAADVFGMDEDKYYMPLLQNGGMHINESRYAIHFCGAMGHYENYEPNSFYEGLLKKYNLI